MDCPETLLVQEEVCSCPTFCALSVSRDGIPMSRVPMGVDLLFFCGGNLAWHVRDPGFTFPTRCWHGVDGGVEEWKDVGQVPWLASLVKWWKEIRFSTVVAGLL